MDFYSSQNIIIRLYDDNYIPNNLIKLYLRFPSSDTPIKLEWISSCWVQQLNLKVPPHPRIIHACPAPSGTGPSTTVKWHFYHKCIHRHGRVVRHAEAKQLFTDLGVGGCAQS